MADLDKAITNIYKGYYGQQDWFRTYEEALVICNWKGETIINCIFITMFTKYLLFAFC